MAILQFRELYNVLVINMLYNGEKNIGNKPNVLSIVANNNNHNNNLILKLTLYKKAQLVWKL